MMAQRYRVTTVRPGRSATLMPRPGSAAGQAGSITKIVVTARAAGTGKLKLGKAISIGIRPRPARVRGTRARRALPRKRGTPDGA
jgi:hypothetical protein